ncbi:MAG: 3D-(3,5/4)-trihydroxycyclohexane-1,2-dione acylhydrolase (decyclizing) [Trueperaceae bacterium]|nr:3D-(3,5/4)-trihydroxycyclohexane-1,2-dione acylhydrolase (decyclizing) [Trueperaceae bacterium]MCW5818410.1 3D-(3,5/4)-trihydroxycyclohexane-1,2-dione acylhydrolase (decyclizing) [Trueperaceae bacterium]
MRLTVGQAIVKYLAAQSSERDGVARRLVPGMFAILGHGNVTGLGQALQELGPEVGLRAYRPQNEQAMVHTAAAFAKHADRLQALACTASIGPGSTNMLTGAAGATINRLPVLLFPSDYFANRIPDPVLQQLEHPLEHDVSVNDAFRPVSRFFTRVTRPEQLLSVLPEAMRVLTDPAEAGAVVIALPEDVQTEAYDWPAELFAERAWRVRRPEPEPELVAEVARRLARARRPLVVCGGGVIYSGASAELAAFARRHGVPVVESQAGKGALAWDHPSNAGAMGAAGGLAANRLAADADLVIAVGTRLGDFVTASKTAFQDPGVEFVSINVVAADAGKLRSLPVVADAKRALERLGAELADAGWSGAPQPWRERVRTVKAEWDGIVDALRSGEGLAATRGGVDPGGVDPGGVGPDGVDAGRLAQAEVIGIVNDAVGGHATVVCAAGSMPGDLLKLWRPEDPKAYHLEYGYSCMGYEIPAGIGVKLAEPEREVVVMIGDGSYLMMNSEIVTALAEGLRFTIVLVDNHGFQSIHGLQRASGTPSFLNELRGRAALGGALDGPYQSVDYTAHAAALGADAVFAPTREALVAALAAARSAERVTVIVVPAHPEKRVPGFEGWWDVPIAEATEQENVRAARWEYDRGRAKQRTV